MANEDTFHLGAKALIRDQKGHGVEETLRRELEEEIGVKNIRIYELLDASVAKLRIHFEHGLILFTYLCSIDNPENIKLTDNEHIQFKWCSLKEAAKLIKVKFSDECVKKIAQLK